MYNDIAILHTSFAGISSIGIIKHLEGYIYHICMSDVGGYEN